MGRRTEEQQSIVDAVVEGETIRNPAFAGSGKTYTCKEVAVAAARRTWYVCFNSKNAKEAKAKMGKHAIASTGHSPAHTALVKRGRIAHARVKGSVMPLVSRLQQDRIVYDLLPLSNGKRRKAALTVTETLRRWMQSAAKRPGPWNVPAEFWLPLETEAAQKEAAITAARAAWELWEKLMEPDCDWPVTHDVYLKAWALGEPKLPFDLILFDEAQDANPVMMDLVMSQPAQQMWIGDSHQAIYKFRDAIDAMKKAPGAEYPLTKSWRFGPNIAAEARIVLGMLGERRALIGGGKHEGMILDDPELPTGEAVLCRGNTGVLREAIKAMDRGEKVAVVGGVGETAVLLDAAYRLFSDEPTNHSEIGLFANWEELVEFAGTNQGNDKRPIVRLVEEYGAAIPGLCERLKKETVDDEEKADLVVSTAHKGKGREWEDVRISDDFPSILNRNEKGEVTGLREEEANLLYVTITRAMRRLNMGGLQERLREEAKDFREWGGIERRPPEPEPEPEGPILVETPTPTLAPPKPKMLGVVVSRERGRTDEFAYEAEALVPGILYAAIKGYSDNSAEEAEDFLALALQKLGLIENREDLQVEDLTGELEERR